MFILFGFDGWYFLSVSNSFVVSIVRLWELKWLTNLTRETIGVRVCRCSKLLHILMWRLFKRNIRTGIFVFPNIFYRRLFSDVAALVSYFSSRHAERTQKASFLFVRKSRESCRTGKWLSAHRYSVALTVNVSYDLRYGAAFSEGVERRFMLHVRSFSTFNLVTRTINIVTRTVFTFNNIGKANHFYCPTITCRSTKHKRYLQKKFTLLSGYIPKVLPMTGLQLLRE